MADLLVYFQNLNWFAIIDFALFVAVAIILLMFFKRRNSLRLALYVCLYILCYGVVVGLYTYFHNGSLYLTYRILQILGIFFMIVFCVVYQQDLKALFSRISKFKDKKEILDYGSTDDDLRLSASEIVKACQTMSKNDIGALIIIAPNNVPNHILETGTILNAQVSSGLIQSIFNTKAPLHDGAVVIKGSHILGAGCFLPISQRADINKELGTRHRAAYGITEESDVLAIIVSEETGVISTVKKDEDIKRYMTPEKLLEQIESAYGINYINRKTKRGKMND